MAINKAGQIAGAMLAAVQLSWNKGLIMNNRKPKQSFVIVQFYLWKLMDRFFEFAKKYKLLFNPMEINNSEGTSAGAFHAFS